jgi:PAS domain S-box-containing protein
MWGYDSPEDLISSIKDIGRQVYVQPERRDEFTRLLRGQGDVHGFEYEALRKDGGTMWVSENARAVRDAGGTVLYYEGNVEDITERKQAEQEHLAHLRFFEKMDKINRAIQGTPDLEQMMSDVLETTLSIFDCDRSWLLYPCDPDAPSFRVPMEVARPEYPGAKVLNVDIPMSPGEAQTMREALESDAPVTYTAGTERPIATAKQFGVQSQMFVPVYPKLGKPWLFGMHQCSYPRVWTEDERKLFQEIGRRLTDGLTSLLAYRDLRESEEMLRESQRIAGLGSYVIDFASGMWTSSNILDEIVGIDETYKRSIESLAALVHPDDRDQIPNYFSNELAGKLAAFDKVVRIIRDNDKAERWVHGLGKLELDERGQIIRMHGTILDVTERKQAEKQLKDSGKRFRALIENAAEMILVIDQAGMIKFASPSIKLIMGYESEDAVGTSFLGWVHPEDVPLALESLASRSKTPGTAPSSITVRGRHADGTWRSVEVLGTNLLGEDAIQGIVLNARDVTERKRHERELEAEAMIAQALSETLELQPLLNKLLEAARHAIPAAEKGSLALMADDEHLQVRAISGYQESSVLGYLYPITWGYAGRVARERHPVLIPNIQVDAGLREDARSATIGELQDLHSAIAVPLLVQDTVIGVLSMESALPGAFNEEDLRLLGNFATSAALIIERAQLFETTRQRVAELEMLHESGLALNQLLTPKEIGYEIIELLKQKMDWHHITIRLYHPQNETLELLAFSQPGLQGDTEQKEIGERFKMLVPKVGVGLSGWAVQNSQTIRSGDVGNDPYYVETYPGLHSGLYVPMKSGQHIIGVISIESEQPNAFSEADERLVATLTNQAASALENARLFEETRQRVLELETVNRISIALRAILDPDEMLAVVLEETLAALKAAHGSINLMNEGTGKLHKAMARGWPSEFTEAPIESGQGIFGTVFATGNFYLSRDFANDPLTRLEARGRLPSGWGGICVPIRSAQKMLGVMLVSIPTEREFNKDEIRLLNTLADMTGNALYRMRLYDETVHRAEEFSSLYETNAIISGEHDLDTLMQTIVKSATGLLKATAGELYIYDPLTQELEVTVATHSFIPVGTRLRFGEGMAGRVAQSLQPLRVDDYSSWEGRSKQYQNAPFRAVLEVPIVFGGELIGVLATYEFGASEHRFSESDERLLSLFAAEASGVIRSARLREETQHRLENLQALREVDRLITSSFDLQPILSTVITHTIIQLGVDAADVLLFNPVLQTLKYAAGYGFNTNGITQTASRLGEGHAGNAALTRRTVHVSNLPETGSQFRRASLLAGENFMEYYGVPLISKGEVKGVLEVFRRSSIHSKPEWVELLETLAGQAAIAIDNTQLFESIQRSNMELALAYDATIEGWSRAMELRDEETEGHTQRVTEMAVTLARALEMTDENVLHLRRGALLHDIGKIGVPDHILLKPGKLTDQEWEIMRKHPQFAYDMLRPIAYLRSSIDIPHLHHEKWDGTGYPQGLKGEQIPLAARIFAIVDVYDALTSDRPYRKAWAKARTLKHIREQSGKHFDPQIVKKFLKIFGNKKKALPFLTG